MNTPDYSALERAAEVSGNFPFPQHSQLERIVTKLRYLGLTTPEDRLCDEAQGGLCFLLEDIAEEIDDIAGDLREECKARIAALAEPEDLKG